MTKKNIVVCFALALTAFGARADVLSLDYGTKGKETYIDNVKISRTGVTTDSKTDLVTMVAAMRQKDIVFMHPHIYVAQFLVADANKYVRSCDANNQPTTDNASLVSMGKQKSVGVRLDYLYSVSADQFDEAFRDGFQANGVNENDPAIAAFLNAVNNGGDVSVGDSWEIVIDREQTVDATGKQKTEDTVRFQDARGHVTTIKGNLLIEQILSLWMGNTAAGDTGLATFKQQLLCGN